MRDIILLITEITAMGGGDGRHEAGHDGSG
jgi:hypothetical protein